MTTLSPDILTRPITHRERCHREMTRDVIFLFQYRHRKTSQTWHTAGVWLDRTEAEDWGREQQHNYGKINERWRVYGIPAEGKLAAMMQREDAMVEVAHA